MCGRVSVGFVLCQSRARKAELARKAASFGKLPQRISRYKYWCVLLSLSSCISVQLSRQFILFVARSARVGASDEEGSPSSSSDDVTTARELQQQQRPRASGDRGDGDGASRGGGSGGGRGRVLSTMGRVGCAAKLVQMGKIIGSDSFKVRAVIGF